MLCVGKNRVTSVLKVPLNSTNQLNRGLTSGWPPT